MNDGVLNETAMRSIYRELPPAAHPQLVVCRWEQTVAAGGAPVTSRIIPDARADIIVDDAGSAMLVGPTMHAEFPTLRAGAVVRGMRLRTEALSGVLGLPGSDLRDLQLPLGAVFAERVAAEIAESVWNGRHPASLPPVEVDTRIARAVQRFQGDIDLDIADVADEVGLSVRHLRRLVHENSGLEPRSIHRVARLHRLLRRAQRAGPGDGLSLLSVASGFSDQSHMSRDVRDLTGATPLELLRERHAAA